jgi:hypothetical protein
MNAEQLKIARLINEYGVDPKDVKRIDGKIYVYVPRKHPNGAMIKEPVELEKIFIA